MTKLYPYQQAGVEFLESHNGRGILGDEPGLGKTVQALFFLSRNPEAWPAVVVCPASLKWHWQREASRHVGVTAQVLEGTSPDPSANLRRRLVIVNYDIVHAWMDHLIRMKPRTLVVDEAQYLAGRITRRAMAVKHLSRRKGKVRVPNLVALTGTAIVNRPSELWPILNMIDPPEFRSYATYANAYCGRKLNFRGVWDDRGATNLDELNKVLGRYMIRRLKKDVLKDLPPKVRTVLPVDLPHKGRREYQAAADDFRRWAARNLAGGGRSLRIESMARMGHLRRLAGRLKLPAVFDWTDDFLNDTDEKLVLFAIHRKVISALRERYGRACVMVDGSVTGRARQVAVDKFLSSRKVRLFVGNVDAAGVGWSARGVSHVAFCELPWSPGRVVQAEDRCHGLHRGRVGHSTNVTFLVARDTIEENLAKLIRSKQRVLDKVLDGKFGRDFNLFDKLARTVTEGD